MRAMRGAILIIGVVLAAMLIGCGSDSSSDTDTSAAKPFRIPAPDPEVVYAEDMKFKPNGLVGPEPKPIIPDVPAPDHLALFDLKEGIGPLADPESTITVQYVGYLYDSKKKFDSSWDQGKPLTFQLGKGQVIPGWEEGLVGMEVSDRRELVIPPDLAYGNEKVGSIPPNSTLVFVVDLLDVKGKIVEPDE